MSAKAAGTETDVDRLHADMARRNTANIRWLVETIAAATAIIIGAMTLLAGALAAEADTTERWNCGWITHGIMIPFCDPPEHTCPIKLTANRDDGTGTVTFDERPPKNAHFETDGAVRTWIIGTRKQSGFVNLPTGRATYSPDGESQIPAFCYRVR